MAQPGGRDRMGRLCQTALRPTSTSAEIPARYTHRVASNQRLISLENDRVTFRWKIYARGNQPATMTLKAVEFVRRFLLHVLPRGFVKVRHFGLLANRGRRRNLALCRKLLVASSSARDFHPAHDRLADQMETDQRDRCPRCQRAHAALGNSVAATPCDRLAPRRHPHGHPNRHVVAKMPGSTILAVQEPKEVRCPGLYRRRQVAHPPASRIVIRRELRAIARPPPLFALPTLHALSLRGPRPNRQR